MGDRIEYTGNYTHSHIGKKGKFIRLDWKDSCQILFDGSEEENGVFLNNISLIKETIK